MLSNKHIHCIALLLAFLTGAISLSQEIIWVRVLSFATASRPETFAHTLGSFLIGIAIGAMVGRRICISKQDFIASAAWMLGISSFIFYFSLPIAAKMTSADQYWPVLGMVCLTAAVAGGIFPLICQLSAVQGSAGKTVSVVYLVNIIGATLGSLFTGFVLLDKMSLNQVAGVTATAGAMAAALVFAMSKATVRTRFIGITFALVLASAPIFLGKSIFSGFLENLQYEKKYPREQPFKKIVQNRSGIITVDDALNPGDADVVYGGGIYDGRYAIDPRSPNGIHRCYMIAALHPEPTRVLEIGLSSGSWAAALLRHDALEELHIVEINPGYLDIIKDYEEHRRIIESSKVKIKIDDGRRWLRRQPDGVKFDFMLMNTTFHWRSHASNLLSVEFLNLCKRHLQPGGVVFYNTTGSDEVVRTAAEVFEYVTMVGNFVAASDSPFNIDSDQRRTNLLRFKDDDGSPTFLRTAEFRSELDRLVKMELPELGNRMRSSNEFDVITDDNMASEFTKRKGYWFSQENSWANLFRKLKEN
mgnify:FL=1